LLYLTHSRSFHHDLPSFLLHTPPPPTSPLFPYTTLFRSHQSGRRRTGQGARQSDRRRAVDEGGRLRDPRSQARQHEDRRAADRRSEEHTSELQSRGHLVCRLLLEKKKKIKRTVITRT